MQFAHMNSNILELYGVSTTNERVDWHMLIANQQCPYLERKCVKIRKSQPDISIGTCSVIHGSKGDAGVIICPHRFLERRQIFLDCIHLLSLHEPGNELHKVSEVDIPGGSVDYVLASVRKGKVVDFVGIELQALDTTGTIWPQRQKLLREMGVDSSYDFEEKKPYGMNWKMTAKTILVQLHHKIETFEQLNRHLVLVIQDPVLDYMKREFNFGHVQQARMGDSMHFHSYSLKDGEETSKISLTNRISTDAQGISKCLGMQVSPSVELQVILSTLQSKISQRTLLYI